MRTGMRFGGMAGGWISILPIQLTINGALLILLSRDSQQRTMRSSRPRSRPPMALLNGWKQIANYLGRGVRTIQRWESLGLPVRQRHGD